MLLIYLQAIRPLARVRRTELVTTGGGPVAKLVAMTFFALQVTAAVAPPAIHGASSDALPVSGPSTQPASPPDQRPTSTKYRGKPARQGEPQRISAKARKAASNLNKDQLNKLIKRIYVAEDRLQAWIVLAPGTTFPRRLLEVVLEHAGVNYGLNHGAIGQASRTDEQPRRLVIASGDPPSPGLSGRDVYGERVDPVGIEVSLVIDDQGLQATALHRPGELVSRASIERLVKQHGLRFGIDKDAVMALWQGPADPSGTVVIARGVAPIPADPGGFVLSERFEQQVQEVTVGTPVAEWHPPIAGSDGMTIFAEKMTVEQRTARLPDRCLGEGGAIAAS